MRTFILNSIVCGVIFFFLFFLPPINIMGQLITPYYYGRTTDYTQIDANRISAWITNYGSFFQDPITGNAGLEWPKGTGHHAVLASGLWMGAKVNGGVRVAVAEFEYEFAPGTVDPVTHQPNDPNDPTYLVYKIERGDTTSWAYQNWPYWDGAPLTPDGKPLLIGDQTLWCVYNDADSAYHVKFGTAPLGVEIQQMAYAWNSENVLLNNLIILRWLIINKGGDTLDNAYVSIWSNPRVGYPDDDLYGCDSTLSLGYSYNAYLYDAEYGKRPPAIGYTLLQGPIVPSPGDTAIFMGHPIYHYKNLPMTSFMVYENNHQNNGSPQNGWEVYNFMRAMWRDGTHLIYYSIGPSTILTNFIYFGDPESGTGWIDDFPENRRFLINSGPFNMAPGDSQEVIAAVYLSRGTTHLNSVTRLKLDHPIIQSFFRHQNLYSSAWHRLTHPDASHTELQVRVNLAEYSSVTSAEFHFTPAFGGEPDFYLSLYDDGQHNDSLAGDGIWGNSITLNNRKYPFHGNLTLLYAGGQEYLPGVFSYLRLRPAPELQNWRVVWENGVQDTSINYNEKVHLQFTIKNRDSLNPIQKYIRITNPNGTVSYNQVIPPGAAVLADSFFLTLYGPPQGDSLYFNVEVDFDYHELTHTYSQPVVPWTPPIFWGDTLEVDILSGVSKNILPVIADPIQLLINHQYLVTYREDTSFVVPLRWRLTDLTEGTIKLDNQPVGSSPEEDYPVVDGIEWKVFNIEPGLQAIVQVANRFGPLPPEQWDSTGAPFGGNDVWHSPSAPSDLNQFFMSAGGGNGTIDRILRNIENAGNHDFEIRFTPAGGVYLWWYDADMWTHVPFEAWDVGPSTYNDFSDDVRCLTGGYSGDNNPGAFDDFSYIDPFSGYPASDWLYLRVPTDSLGTYSVFLQDIMSGAYTYDWWGHSKEVLARLIFCDYAGNQKLPEKGTIIRFITNKLTTPGDSLLITVPDTTALGIPGSQSIKTFSLSQNYPNPFNPVTHIRFRLARSVKVKIEIFNVLGQRVKILVDKKLPVGEHTVSWDGKNDAHHRLGSGIYFYRITAGDFVKTRKMILLR